MVFYGPSGTGKTTIANIIARQTNKTLHRLNATTASLQDVKDIIADVGTLLAPRRDLAVPGRDPVLQQEAAAEPAGVHGERLPDPHRLHHGEPVLLRLRRPALPQHGVRVQGRDAGGGGARRPPGPEDRAGEISPAPGVGGGGAPADRHRLRRRCPQGHQRGGAPLPGVRAEGREADPDNGGRFTGGPAQRHAVRQGRRRHVRRRLRPDEVPPGQRPGRGPPLPGPVPGGGGTSSPPAGGCCAPPARTWGWPIPRPSPS